MKKQTILEELAESLKIVWDSYLRGEIDANQIEPILRAAYRPL